MEIADVRSGGSSPSVRRSLRACRTCKSDGCGWIVSWPDWNWKKIQRGEPLSEYTGIFALHDPLHGLLDEVNE